METKIVYVLVSQESDYYYEMFLLSHYSLRLYHPKSDVEVVLVMDKDTNKRLCEKKASVLDDVTPKVVDVPEEFTIMQRSRYLKTFLRNLVIGDFLYLDTDTIICNPLHDVDSFHGDICAILDNHHGKINEYQLSLFPDASDWKCLEGTKHYNSGVLYAKDNSDVHDFFERWHNYWVQELPFGVSFDQVALRKTVLETDIVEELNGKWNCQVTRTSSEAFRDQAIIIHYQDSSSSIYYPITSETSFLKIKIAGEIIPDLKLLAKQGKYAFSTKYKIVSGKEFTFLESPMYSIFIDYPIYYHFLEKISFVYRYIITSLYNFKIRCLQKKTTIGKCSKASYS